MLIGVTGSIGSGKSLVAGFLGELLGAPVYSSDEICRQLLEKDEAGYNAFVKTWGARFLDEKEEIDRVLLRSAVFRNEALRLQLEHILHPLVRQTLFEIKQSSEPRALQIAEVPLLFECSWQSDFDAVVCVVADRENVLQRVASRDLVKREDVEKILDVQMDPALKASRSDWVID
ncbi:MAG: dephospho-CoA kinase, partial [Desulfofustis sp.]